MRGAPPESWEELYTVMTLEKPRCSPPNKKADADLASLWGLRSVLACGAKQHRTMYNYCRMPPTAVASCKKGRWLPNRLEEASSAPPGAAVGRIGISRGTSPSAQLYVHKPKMRQNIQLITLMRYFAEIMDASFFSSKGTRHPSHPRDSSFATPTHGKACINLSQSRASVSRYRCHARSTGRSFFLTCDLVCFKRAWQAKDGISLFRRVRPHMSCRQANIVDECWFAPRCRNRNTSEVYGLPRAISCRLAVDRHCS